MKKITKVFLVFGLMLTLGLTKVVAQDYVGTYSGTLTFIITVFPLDESLLNMQIENQALEVGENMLFFPDIPVLKEGDLFDIGFPNAEFASNGNISAPQVKGSFFDITLLFTFTSGNVSGNTINCIFHLVDSATNGTIVDVVAGYTGTKKEDNGINKIENTGINIYPNPTAGKLTIDNGELPIGKVDIYDINGKKQFTVNSSQSILDLNISHFLKGVYILRINDKQIKVIRE